MKQSSSILCVFLCLALPLAKAQDGAKPQGNRIQFAPVFVSPTMQWAVPNGSLNGPPVIWTQQVSPGPLALTVGVGGRGSLYDIDWVAYYKTPWAVPFTGWAVPASNLNGPPANLAPMMMPH